MGERPNRIKVRQYSITTAADGTASATTPDWNETKGINGEVLAIEINYAADVAATCDVVITSDWPSDTILSLTNYNTDGIWYPRNVLCSNNGTLQENWTAAPYVVQGIITIAVTGGGDSKIITVKVFYR